MRNARAFFRRHRRLVSLSVIGLLAAAGVTAVALAAVWDDDDGGGGGALDAQSGPRTPGVRVASATSVTPATATPTAVPTATSTPAVAATSPAPPAAAATATPGVVGPPVAPIGGSSTGWVGVNNYTLAQEDGFLTECGDGSNLLLDAKFATLRGAGVDVVRFWAFQAHAQRYGQREWTALDRVFARAQAHGIQLIPVLGNHRPDCEGPDDFEKGCGWYQGGFRAPYSGLLTGFDQWATDIATRYAGHPALKAWEVINEPVVACVHEFFADVTNRIRAADPATRISLGGGDEGWECMVECALPNVDMVSSHDYNFVKEAMPAGIGREIDEAKALGKPHYVAETGINCEDDGQAGDPDDDTALCSPCDGPLRAQYLRAKMLAAFERGAEGYVLWAYSHTQAAGTCSFSFGPGSPVMGIFAEF